MPSSCPLYFHREFPSLPVGIPQHRRHLHAPSGCLLDGCLAHGSVGHPADHVIRVGCRLVASEVEEARLAQDKRPAVEVEL